MLNNIRFKKAREQSGQSTVEYIILVTAVVAVIILFLLGPNSLFSQRMTNTYNETMQGIRDKSADLADSHRTAASNTAAPPSDVQINILQNIF